MRKCNHCANLTENWTCDKCQATQAINDIVKRMNELESAVKDALKWFNRIGISAKSDEEFTTIYIIINNYDFEISTDEIYYRANVWRLGNN